MVLLARYMQKPSMVLSIVNALVWWCCCIAKATRMQYNVRQQMFLVQWTQHYHIVTGTNNGVKIIVQHEFELTIGALD